MAGSAKQNKIEELIAKSHESLRRGMWFEVERLAARALSMARQDQAFDLMAAAVPALQDARRQRMQRAIQGCRTIKIIDEPITEDTAIRPGCYLVQPPLVGSDARRFRLLALGNEIPVLVLCREPLTQLKLTPIVAISPGSTLRVRIASAGKLEHPDKAWFLNALRELGDTSIACIDETLPLVRRIDLLLQYLDALPEHENLHHALEAACREAHELGGQAKSVSAMKSDES